MVDSTDSKRVYMANPVGQGRRAMAPERRDALPLALLVFVGGGYLWYTQSQQAGSAAAPAKDYIVRECKQGSGVTQVFPTGVSSSMVDMEKCVPLVGRRLSEAASSGGAQNDGECEMKSCPSSASTSAAPPPLKVYPCNAGDDRRPVAQRPRLGQPPSWPRGNKGEHRTTKGVPCTLAKGLGSSDKKDCYWHWRDEKTAWDKELGRRRVNAHAGWVCDRRKEAEKNPNGDHDGGTTRAESETAFCARLGISRREHKREDLSKTGRVIGSAHFARLAHPQPFREPTGSERPADVATRDADVRRLFGTFPPLLLGQQHSHGPASAFARNLKGMSTLVTAILTGVLIFVWDTEFYTSQHAFFGYNWQICGELIDRTGSVVSGGLPAAACVLKQRMSHGDAEKHRATIQAFETGQIAWDDSRIDGVRPYIVGPDEEDAAIQVMRDHDDNILASVGSPELIYFQLAGRRTATDGIDLQQCLRTVMREFSPHSQSPLIWTDSMDLWSRFFAFRYNAHHLARPDVIFEAKSFHGCSVIFALIV
jgi:hypothetical protein